MMRSDAESIVHPTVPSVNYCFLNPAWMPEWFWLPVAHEVAKSGSDYFIPPIQRDVLGGSIASDVDIVETTMANRSAQYIVALSRGVEYAVRYLDRLDKSGRLANVVGWTVISSVGPRGYETMLNNARRAQDRHTEEYIAAVSMDGEGYESIEPKAAETCMLHDLGDDDLTDQLIRDLTKARPITASEVKDVPFIRPGSVPLRWYIGANDKVDNPTMSANVAQNIFGIDPIITGWGHVGPLTHTRQVAEALLADVAVANLQKAGQE